MDEVTYRWLDGPTATQDEWDKLELILASRGWMSFNRQVTRILVAECGTKLAGFFGMSLVPHAGPLFVSPSFRGTTVANELAERMNEFFVETHARGVIIVAESPMVERMCEQRGMIRVTKPIYVLVGAEV
jgi:hypothetical protein